MSNTKQEIMDFLELNSIDYDSGDTKEVLLALIPEEWLNYED
jgi:hypothetical protein